MLTGRTLVTVPVPASKNPLHLSALRNARMLAVAEQLASEGKPSYLGDLYARMRFRGMTHSQTDRAIDDLAESGRVTIYTTRYGGLAVKLRGSA